MSYFECRKLRVIMIKLLAIRKIKTEKTVIKESNSARQPPTG